ncbi:hypothetical protein ABPG72_020772 [Tetrahymena utriculariae]
MGVLNLDLVIFGSLIFIYNRIKQIKPDMFFLAKGTAVFLPPDEKDVKETRKEQEKNSKKGGKTPLMPIKMIKATYDFFSKYKFCIELEIVIMLLVCLVGQITISEILRMTLLKKLEIEKNDLNFGFALGLSIFLLTVAYLCKSVKIAGWKSTDVKTAFWIAVLTCLVVLTIFIGIKDLIPVDFKKAYLSQSKHIDFVLSPEKSSTAAIENPEISILIFRISCVFLIGVITFSFSPTIIRFTNCYSWNLSQQAELQQKEEEKAEKEAELNNSKKNDNPFENVIEDREENLEQGVQKQSNLTLQEHKKNMTIFNISLVINLITIVLWITPVTDALDSNFGKELTQYLPLIRYLLVFVQAGLLLLTIKYQIQVFMFKSFYYLKTLSTDSSEINYQAVKVKTSAYVQSLIYVTFQIFVTIVIPAVLSGLLLYKVYICPNSNIPTQPTENQQVQDQGQTESGDFIQIHTAHMKKVYGNIKEHSLFSNYFIETVLSFFLFNILLIQYALKIIFIIVSRQSKGV